MGAGRQPAHPVGSQLPAVRARHRTRTNPKLFRDVHVRDNRDYPRLLRKAMDFVSTEGIAVVLTPGRYNSAFFEHAYLAEKTGAALARDVFGADDEIYNAILWHSTGKANMTLLEKVIYLADYIEPNRDFDGVEDLRKVVWEDLDKGLEMGLAMTVEEMEQMGNPVHHNTLQALEYLRGHTHE